MPKNSSRKILSSVTKKKIVKSPKIEIDLSEDQKNIQKKLSTLANLATKEAMDKISDFIISTKDTGLREYAQIAYNDAEFSYFTPVNEREEKELLLAKMIKEHDDRLLNLMSKADGAKLELRRLEIEREVDKRISPKPKKETAKDALDFSLDESYRFSEDFYKTVEGRLMEIESDVKYESAWINEAEGMIKTDRFKNLPGDFFDHMHFDGEGGTFWTDSMGMDQDECSCEGGCCGGSEEINTSDIPF